MFGNLILKDHSISKIMLRILRNPLTILFACALGTYVGFAEPDLGQSMKPLSDLYLSLLKISVIPFILLSITSNISKLISQQERSENISRIIRAFVFSLFAISLFGLIAALILKPGDGFSELKIFRDLVEKSNGSLTLSVTLDESLDKNLDFDFFSFLLNAIPSNVFQSFSESKVLQIVVFSILFGIAVGCLPQEGRQKFMDLIDAAQHSFLFIIKAVVTILPIGVFAVISSQFSALTPEILLVLSKFIAYVYAMMGLCFIISSVVIWFSSKRTLKENYDALKLPTLMSITTQNSLAAMPIAINALITKLKFDPMMCNLLMPLGIAINRFGNVLYFAFTSVFVAQIYNADLSLMGYTIIIIGSIFAGFATSGVTSIATLGMISIVLGPLGLPVGAVLIILTAVDPLIDPIRTLTIVHTNCALTAYLARGKALRQR